MSKGNSAMATKSRMTQLSTINGSVHPASDLCLHPLKQIVSVEHVPVGGAVTFAYPEAHDSCLLLRPEEKTFIAFSQKCTHLSCAVVPRPEEGRLYCPCHEGSFELATGEPITGPPRRPLPKITLEVRNGTVYATGVELRTV